MNEYFVCVLNTGNRVDFDRKAKNVERIMEDEYYVYDERGNVIGRVPIENVCYFCKTTDKCKEE